MESSSKFDSDRDKAVFEFHQLAKVFDNMEMETAAIAVAAAFFTTDIVFAFASANGLDKDKALVVLSSLFKDMESRLRDCYVAA